MPEREEEWIEGRSADDAEHEGAKEGEAVRALRPMGRVAREELHVLLSRVSERRHLKPAAAGESGGGAFGDCGGAACGGSGSKGGEGVRR